jgi:hypothetical protein
MLPPDNGLAQSANTALLAIPPVLLGARAVSCTEPGMGIRGHWLTSISVSVLFTAKIFTGISVSVLIPVPAVTSTGIGTNTGTYYLVLFGANSISGTENFTNTSHTKYDSY